MKKKLILLVFVGIAYAAGNQSVSGVVLCDKDLLKIFKVIEDNVAVDDTLASHMSKIQEVYSINSDIELDFFCQYIKLLSLLCIDIVELSSSENICQLHKPLIDILERLVADMCNYRACFSNEEQRTLISALFDAFYSYTDRVFSSCAKENYVVSEDTWWKILPSLNSHYRVFSDMVYLLKICNEFTFLYNCYCRGDIQGDAFSKNWHKFIHSHTRSIETIICGNVSQLEQFYESYDSILAQAISIEHYSYTTRIVLPMLRAMKKDLQCIQKLSGSDSDYIYLLNNEAKTKAKQKMDKAAQSVASAQMLDKYSNRVVYTTHELAISQWQVLSAEFERDIH